MVGIRHFFCSAAVALVASPAHVLAQALPTGSSSQATITQIAGTTLQINQSINATINWTTFSIGGGNPVTFAQPSASSIAFNQVTGNNVSAIFGQLVANGQVFLVNPSGVIFRPGSAQVGVPTPATTFGTAIASTSGAQAQSQSAANLQATGVDFVLEKRDAGF